MAKHDIVLLNVTSSGFETEIGNNVARIKGDSNKVFTVQPSGSINTLISVDSNNPSVTFNARITSSGHISSSLNSTASFGRVNVTRLIGDASQMTNTNEQGHVSSSKQLASRISGAFTAGFTLDGENRLISGSRTSTGSFTRVFSNIYVGDASDMHSVNEQGHFSSSAQMASNISGSFTSGIEYSGKISGSATSTGSFGRVNFSGQIAGNAAAVSIDQTGFFSGSAQMASNISGSFNKGFIHTGKISGSATSTGSFSRVDADMFVGDASQVTGVAGALPANVISGSAQIASNISGSFNKGFVLQSKTVSISGSATSTGSFGRIIMGPTAGLTSSIADTSQLIIPGKAGLISSSAQLATSISGSFTKGLTMNNGLISGSRISTGSFSLVKNVVSISGNASQVTNVTLSPGVVSGSAQLASNISGAFQRGFEFTGFTREETLTGSYAGVSGSAFAYAGNATTMSISSICGSDFDYRLYDLMNGRIQGKYNGHRTGVWETSTALPAARRDHGSYGTTDAALLTAGCFSPTIFASTLKFNGSTYSDSANMIQARWVVAGAGTQNAAAIFQGCNPASPYADYTKYTEHYNGSTWSENSDRINTTTSGGGFGTQNSAVAVGGSPPLQTTELWNGSVWSSGPNHNQASKTKFGSAGSSDAGIIHAGGTPNRYNSTAHTELWNGTSWTNGPDSVQASYGNSTAGSSNGAHSVGIHCQLNGGNFSNIYDGTTWRGGPNLSNARGYAGTNAAGLSSRHMYAGGQHNPSSPWNTHPTCTEIYVGRNYTTASFAKVNFNSLSFTGPYGIASSSLTGYEDGHISGAAQLATSISGSFNKGFGFTGEITGSSASALKIQSLNIAGTTAFANTKLSKNWDGSFVQTATFGNNLGTAISGAFNAGFNTYGDISGSVSSTGSFSRIESKRIFTKGIAGERKLVSGSMDHDHYISGSFATKTTKPINIPTFGRGHTVNTQQFSATGSMEDQTYRAQAGQLFVDNFGRLNMTVQTGSMVAVAGTWEAGPTGLLNEGPGGAAATGTPNAIIQSAPWHIYSGSAIYDGISWTRVSDVTSIHGSTVANCSIGTVDAALFLRHSGGSTSGTNTGKYGSFPNVPAHATFQEDWDGVGWTRGPSDAGTYVKRSGTSGKVGSVNSHIAFNGDDYPTLVGTATWNGVTWQDVGPHTPTARDSGAGFGGVYDGVVAGGASPNNTCVDEWNGTTWATATALPTGQSGGGGAGPQTAGIIMGGSPAKEVQEYNGTSWSEGTSIPVNFSSHATGGSSGKAFAISIASTYFWTGGFVTGSADTHNEFSQNPTGRYLLTKKLQANQSPGNAGGGSTSSEEDFGGGY